MSEIFANNVVRERSDWRREKLGSLVSIRYGKNLPTKSFKENGYPVFGANGIIGFNDNYLYEDEQVLISCRGAYSGKINISPPQCFVTNNSLVLELPKDSPLNKRFLFYGLQAVDRSKMVTGSAQPQVTINNAEVIEMPVPPLGEQARIVAEIEKQFTRLEAGVAALKRVQANLKRYRAAVLKAACEGKLVPTEAELARKEKRTYETGEQLLTRILKERREKWEGRGKYKEPVGADVSNLPELPKGWIWATMPQLGELNRGKSKHRPRDDRRLYEGPYPFIQTGDVRQSSGTIREHRQTYSEFGLKQSRLWPAGTLCITIAANIAETGLLTFPACFPDSIVGFVHYGPLITTRYVEFFIRTAKKGLERFAPATAQKNINLDVLQNVAVPLPPLAEQQRIVEELERLFSVVEEMESTVEVNLQRASRLRQAVLQKAFSGKMLEKTGQRLESMG